MQIQSHHASIKTLQRLPVNFGVKSQLHMMASEALQDPKAAYLASSLLVSCATVSASVGPRGLKRLLVHPAVHPTPEALLSLSAWKLHPLPSCEAPPLLLAV